MRRRKGSQGAMGRLSPPAPQAVIQNPFSNGGSPAAEAVSGEARFAYFPASSVGDTTAVSVQTTDQSLQAGGKQGETPAAPARASTDACHPSQGQR